MGEEVLWGEEDASFDILYSVPPFAQYLCLPLIQPKSSCKKLLGDTHEVPVGVEFYLEVV